MGLMGVLQAVGRDPVPEVPGSNENQCKGLPSRDASDAHFQLTSQIERSL